VRAHTAAVIIDVDGTLVDSVDLHAQAWKDALERFDPADLHAHFASAPLG
jgi:beta-phosphoglucomutase-like phosphatase (HAD superfamily)